MLGQVPSAVPGWGPSNVPEQVLSIVWHQAYAVLGEGLFMGQDGFLCSVRAGCPLICSAMG